MQVGPILPHQLLTSLMRAVVVAWNDPVDTLTRRMAMAESLGFACGLGESEMEQVGGVPLQCGSLCLSVDTDTQCATL